MHVLTYGPTIAALTAHLERSLTDSFYKLKIHYEGVYYDISFFYLIDLHY